ncbi:g9556 [Coccomyxa elongata]
MAGDGLGTGPEGAAPDELVLRDICENSVEGRVSAEDADRAIAKALQDQERAFMLLNTYGGENGYQDQTSDEDNDDDDEEGWVEDDGTAEELDRDSSVEGEEEEDDDAALARRLQEAEDREHYRRLLELHGADGILEEYNEDEEDGYISDDSVDPDNMTYEELQALGEAVGTVSRGVSQDIIDALPNAKYTSRFSDEKPSNGSEEEEQCAVCRMEFEAGEDVRLLPCSHVYHPDCIGQWLHINKACPICSQEVTNPARKSESKVGTVLEPRNK